MKKNQAPGALLGVAAGDAVGVPFEFRTRLELSRYPAAGMSGFGSHMQLPGTWSDDSSLTFCLAESLLNGYDLRDMAGRFVQWKNDAYWAARNEVFDIGITTSHAIKRLENILKTGGTDELQKLKNQGTETENGNGALMRILPMLWYIKGKDAVEQFELVREVSALTHRHIRSAMACMIYLKMAEFLLTGRDKAACYSDTREAVLELWKQPAFGLAEQMHFNRIIQNDISLLDKDQIKSGGYVLDSLEAAFWCFLRQDNFEKTVLTAVNLGFDTDTTAAIAGGMAGIYYGKEGIPADWLSALARLEDITALAEKLDAAYPD
ncbi:MAG TPA: ADP-ribosylglycohydrolase family protein [Flavilitoribacter sp.]|nr:ADP-ribosylglycohydrolase family protein [Flavilitoribacter sp.]HMQ87119.1 ADP-ribosylglycohydrolase family protein [Flavilitoribacter sp.]